MTATAMMGAMLKGDRKLPQSLWMVKDLLDELLPMQMLKEVRAYVDHPQTPFSIK